MSWTDPRTWLAGEDPTAALLNIQLRDNLKAIGDPWTSYAPTWTSTGTAPAIGNGTITGKYMRAGKLVIGRFQLVMGSTTTYGTGSWLVGLPVAAAEGFPFAFGTVQCFDASATLNHSRVLQSSGSTSALVAADAAGVRVTNLAPFTWTTSDRLAGIFSYEAA
ncbi:hypothetical protein [Kribbella deserti]|uniref:Minor tail protein n=1 Tax=Kribbella deserti TaxID=1926257 RepID=A0ABV6QV78_9ACTN